ncbi:MAG: DUF3029 family protein [Victivallales bacterium]|nr:DUF3029 family protein [Victivallales bacterium]
MFEQSRNILRTLLAEGVRQFSDSASPLRKGADVFTYLLEGLPRCVGEYPGTFGLEHLPLLERKAWEERIRAAQSSPFIFGSEPPTISKFRELGFSVDNGGQGHITISYDHVLQNGLKSFYEQLDLSHEFDRTVGDTLLAVKQFAESYHCRVPWEPARCFDEALNSVWLVYEAIVLSEHVPWSYSWGRMDQYLLPFAKGLSRSEMKNKFVSFFHFFNQVPFKDDACALDIGGPDGFNEVSRAIIDAVAEVHLPAPLLAVRVSRNLPNEDFALLLRKELLTCGQPTFYGEESCRKALKRRGLPEYEIENWAASSCMGLMIPGREWQDMWGAVLQMTTALELALNHGSFFLMPPPVPCGVPPMKLADYDCFETLYQQVLRYIRYFFDVFIPAESAKCAVCMKQLQNAFAVPFHDNCLARKKEMRDGGIRYRTMIVETMGLANLADSLYTLDQLVFTQKKYTLEKILTALKNDFTGAEELLAEIHALPKYGQNDEKADALMRRLSADVADIAEHFSSNGFFCAPSLHTLDHHVSYGQRIEATADGRHAHAPLAKNAGTGVEVQATHTQRILSTLSWDQSRFSGGQPLDLWINPAEWDTSDGIYAYTKLFRTYLEGGGLQLQVNGADPETLKDAMTHPEQYPDLTVRIGGFSVRFVQLDARKQLDLIKRFSNGI